MQIEIGNLPIWNGVKDKPGFKNLRFALHNDNGLIRLNLAENEISQIYRTYSDEDYIHMTAPPGVSAWGIRLGELYFKVLSDWVGDLSGKTVIEIGSGTLYIAERSVNELHALRFIACDPALNRQATNNRICVSRNFFSRKLFEDQSAKTDLIVSINNLEHIPDLREYLDDAHDLLNPDTGLFFVIIPDCSRGLKTGDLGICVHEHINYFTDESVRSTFLSHGFSIKKIMSYEDTFFILASPARKPGHARISDSNSDVLLRTYENRVKSNLAYSDDLIAQAKSRGPVAIHGCCVGLNNILGLLEIHDDENIFLFDGDIQKKGKYMPVFNRPIYSAEETAYRDMKTVIVAALTYYDEIKKGLVSLHNIPSTNIHPIIPYN